MLLFPQPLALCAMHDVHESHGLCRRLPFRLTKHTGLDKWLMQAIDPPFTEQGLIKSIAADIHKLHRSAFVGKASLFFRVAQHACLAPTVPGTTRCPPTWQVCCVCAAFGHLGPGLLSGDSRLDTRELLDTALWEI